MAVAALLLMASVLAAIGGFVVADRRTGRPARLAGPSVAAALPPVQLVPAGDRATPDGAGARGVLTVTLRNQLDAPVGLSALALDVGGVRIVSVRPALERPLAPREVRDLVIDYAVADCADLVLPGRLQLTSHTDAPPAGSAGELDAGPASQRPGPAQGARAQAVVFFDRGPAVAGALPLAACPTVLPRPPDLGVRTLGGSSGRSAVGARGTVELEVRNAGPPLQLLSVGAEVPGVVFQVVTPPNGVSLDVDGRVALRLAFVVPDCTRLRRTGRLVLRVVQDGLVRELGLTITNDFEAGTVRQAALDRVLQACA